MLGRMSRRLVLLAVITPVLGLLTCCDQTKALGDKASICTQALGLATLIPGGDPEKTRREALDKAEKLKTLAADAEERDVKGALTTLSNEYVEVSKRRAEDLRNFAGWAGDLFTNQEKVRRICL
jgi:hypothetical protein